MKGTCMSNDISTCKVSADSVNSSLIIEIGSKDMWCKDRFEVRIATQAKTTKFGTVSVFLSMHKVT